MPDGAIPCRIDRSTAEPSPKMSLPFDPQVPRTLRPPRGDDCGPSFSGPPGDHRGERAGARRRDRAGRSRPRGPAVGPARRPGRDGAHAGRCARGPADAHPPRPRHSLRRDRAGSARRDRVRARGGRTPHGRPGATARVGGAHLRRRDGDAVGAISFPCRERRSGWWTRGTWWPSVAAASKSRTFPDTPATMWPTTRPRREPRGWATWAAYGSGAVRCFPSRRRPTSTWRPGRRAWNG